MLKVFKENSKVGTVGARLHYEDNTIQHNGIIMQLQPGNDQLILTHASLGAYYSYTTGIKEVVGSTAALMMIRKNTFNNAGGYNENYTTCFEDVELNLSVRLLGFKNYYDGSLVAYHYESKTRGKDEKNSRGEQEDYNKFLLPFVKNNKNKLFN